MDEPLGALDKKLRDQMQIEIKRLHTRARHHDPLRHARPGGGADDVRPHLPDEPWRGSSRSARRESSISGRARSSPPTSSATPTSVAAVALGRGEWRARAAGTARRRAPPARRQPLALCRRVIPAREHPRARSRRARRQRVGGAVEEVVFVGGVTQHLRRACDGRSRARASGSAADAAALPSAGDRRARSAGPARAQQSCCRATRTRLAHPIGARAGPRPARRLPRAPLARRSCRCSLSSRVLFVYPVAELLLAERSWTGSGELTARALRAHRRNRRLCSACC